MRNDVYEDTALRTFALGIARNMVGPNLPIEDVLPNLGLEEDEYEALCADPTFQRYVDHYSTELSENGFSFEAKARVLAEDLLPLAYQIARDTDVAMGIRVKMIENLVEWGNLKPKKDSLPVQPGTGFSITINLPNGLEGVARPKERVVNEPRERVNLPTLPPERRKGFMFETAEEAPQNHRSALAEQLSGIFEQDVEYVEDDDL